MTGALARSCADVIRRVGEGGKRGSKEKRIETSSFETLYPKSQEDGE
jgi:hypothetical protein